MSAPDEAGLARSPGRPSLRARLVRHVTWPLALTWLMGTAVGVSVAYHFAQRAFDRALLDDAYSVASHVKLDQGELYLELSTAEMGALLFDQTEKVFFAVMRPDGSVVAGHPGLHAPSPTGTARTRFADINYQGQALRSVVLRRGEPVQFEVLVAQTQGSRDALLNRLLLFSALPQLLLLIALAWWLARAIGQELQPLARLEQLVNQRDAQDLTPVPVATSSRDVERLTQAINALLARVGQGLQAQREFSGNVAHELRTPLAGIRALADYALARTDPAVWREQLQRIGESEARASRLVEQLLALALAQEARAGWATEVVALDSVVRDTVMRYLPRADAAQVDLGVQGLDQPVWAAANVALVEGILGNLLDNALRYGRAADGAASAITVALAARPDAVVLSVSDNGVGLSREEQLRLVRRGVRGVSAERLGQGAGLGLAIVTQFAQAMQAEFSIGPNEAGPGLCAQVRFRPASPQAALEPAVPAQ